MPGAFAHITAVQSASVTASLAKLSSMPNQAKLIISTNPNYLELGCVSPDYPYLAVADSAQNHWADLMHYEKTGEMIKSAIAEIKTLSGYQFERCFAWLCGYVAHVIADITIHPVVELKVGPYQENKTAHRICEMNQDAYIWQRLNLGQIGHADRVKQSIGSCVDSDGLLTSEITETWDKCLKRVYPEYSRSNTANFKQWNRGFLLVVDTVDEGHRLFPIARHVAAKYGVTYPNDNEVNNDYIEDLKTPIGYQNYDAIFDRAVTNIQRYWIIVANAVFEGRSTEEILNWNLDTGKCPDGNLTAWSN